VKPEDKRMMKHLLFAESKDSTGFTCKVFLSPNEGNAFYSMVAVFKKFT
jgi:hypothetical protein